MEKTVEIQLAEAKAQWVKDALAKIELIEDGKDISADWYGATVRLKMVFGAIISSV
jgi:outer membrane protein OmpA-like peptidoglycan-associated protein